MAAGLPGTCRPRLMGLALTMGPALNLAKQSARSGREGRPQSRGVCGLQALDLFRRRTGSRQFFEVDLHKEVPHGDPHPSPPLAPCKPALRSDLQETLLP